MRAIARATRIPATPLALIAAGALIVIAVYGLAATALAQSGPASEREGHARQACADRWGWMRNSYIRPGTRAIITSTSPCEISFEYGDRGDGGFRFCRARSTSSAPTRAPATRTLSFPAPPTGTRWRELAAGSCLTTRRLNGAGSRVRNG